MATEYFVDSGNNSDQQVRMIGFETDMTVARNVGGQASEDAREGCHPRTIRFIGGPDRATVDRSLSSHVDQRKNVMMAILCDPEFAASADSDADQRSVLIAEVPQTVDRKTIETGVKLLLRANPDEFVIQVRSSLRDRIEDSDGLMGQFETAWRCGHSVTCCIVAERAAFMSAITTILLRWEEGLWERELGNFAVQWGCEDLTSETVLKMKSVISFNGHQVLS